MANEKILERIRKLLAMAGDTSSPNEATIAAGRARKLMDQYQVSEFDLKTAKDEDFGTADQLHMEKWQGMLGLAMAWLNDVNCRIVASPVSGISLIRFEGYLVDAVTAKELWLYLAAQCEKQSQRVKGRKAPFKQGFAAGVQQQVREILKERNKVQMSNGTSLVVCKRNLVTEKFGQMRTVQGKASNSSNYSVGYSAGMKAGLNRQVNTTNYKQIR